MAAILQFRQGSKTSFISSGPFISEPFFDTDTNIIHIGVSGSSTITLTKLEDINSGSFSVSGDISGSNLYLTGDITASNTLLSGDITIGGNIILGDQVQDTITVSGQFDSDLIPSASEEYNIGSQTKKWNHLYAVSGSIDSIDLVSNLPSGTVSGSTQITDGSGIVSSSNQIDTGSTHFIEGVQLYSINGVNALSGLYGGAGGLGVQIRGLSADGLSFDGPGNLIIDTGSDYFVSGAQEASLLGLPQGTVSSSQQVVDFLPTNTVSGSVQVLGGTNIVSSSVQVISFLPTNTISGSQQVIDFLPTNVLSGSQQVISFLPSGTVSGSQQIIDSLPTGTVSGSSQISELTHIHSFTSSYTDAISLNGDDVTILGNLTVQGTQTQLNTATLNIEDKNLLIASGAADSSAANGAGITIDGANKSLEWEHGTSQFVFNAQVSSSIGFKGDGSQLVFPNTNIVSSSQQVIDFLPSGTVSGSNQITDGSGIVSSSNQIDTGSIHFQQGVELYSINGINPLSGLYGGVGGLGVMIRGLSADGLSFDGPGNLIIDTGSDYFVSGAQEASLLGLPQGTVSGSDQVTQSLDLRYLEIDGDNVLSSSNENFLDYSQSVDLKLLNTLSSGSETSQSLHTLVGSFPTSGSLGSAAFYNVSSSLYNDPDSVPTVKAVFDYINNTIGAADITGVSASLGLSGGGDGGYVSLSLDTASAHFQAGVELYGTSQVEVVNILNDNNILSGSYLGTATTSNLTEGSNLYYTTNRVQSYLDSIGIISSSIQFDGDDVNLGDITGSYIRGGTGHFTGVLQVSPYALGGVPYIPSFYVNSDGDTSIRGTLQLGPVGHITDVSASISSIDVLNTTQNNRLDSLESLSSSLDTNVSTSEILIKNTDGTFTGSNSYADSNNLAVGTSTPINLGATQFTINDSNTPGQTGLISFTDSDVVKSFDYVASDVRYIDTNAGVSIAIKPDADPNKSWIFDTDGDLVSGNGNWSSGNIYANNLIASSSVTASNMLVDNDIIANNFIGNIQSTNGVISGSEQLPSGLISGSAITTDGTDLVAIGTSTTNVSDLGSGNQLSLYGQAGVASGILTFDEGGTVQSYDYTAGSVRYIDTNAGVSIAIKPDSDALKSWVFDTDGDLVSNGGDWQSGNLYLSNVIARNAVTASDMLVENIVVSGTGSFASFVATQTSVQYIGDSIIVLNNSTPTERYAGLAVYDSGSAGVTASLQFDGLTNDWFYQYSDDGGVTSEHGAILFGPEYSTKGTPTYPTNNTIQKGNGGHHLLDSNITDDGTTITLDSNTTVNGVLSATTFEGMISGSTFASPSQGNLDAVINGNTQSIDLGLQTTDDVTFNTVSATGDIVAYASSDRRLKEEITPISNPIEKINQIGGYSFVWNTEKQHIYKGKDYGVIAQEIEEVLPELVQNRENGYKAVKYDKLVSLLIEGIKELSQEVKELKEKINKE